MPTPERIENSAFPRRALRSSCCRSNVCSFMVRSFRFEFSSYCSREAKRILEAIAPRAREKCFFVTQEFVHPVHLLHIRVQFKSELRRHCSGRDLMLPLGEGNLLSKRIHPRLRQRKHIVAHSSGATVEFQRGCRKETATSENALFHVVQPRCQHRVQSL